jgi:hypothetical protein
MDVGFSLYDLDDELIIPYYNKQGIHSGDIVIPNTNPFLHHHTVHLIETSHASPLATQTSPTKNLMPGINRSEPVGETNVDNQTTLVDFLLYSQFAGNNNIEYQISLIAPDGTPVNYLSANTNYYIVESSGLNVLTVFDPEPGLWQVLAHTESKQQNNNFDFITVSYFASQIIASSIISDQTNDLNDPILLATLIEVPNISLFDEYSLDVTVSISSESGTHEAISLDMIELTEQGFVASKPFMADTTGLHQYTMTIYGFYNGFVFERAIYGNFMVEDYTPRLNIPNLWIIRNMLTPLGRS